MSIFRTGLSIDPNSYVDAAKKQSELLDLQRRNQQRIDSTVDIDKKVHVK